MRLPKNTWLYAEIPKRYRHRPAQSQRVRQQVRRLCHQDGHRRRSHPSHYNAADLTFHYANGSRIFIAGMKDEGQRQALRSISGYGAADFIWGEEANALTEDDHNELLGRLRGTAAPWRQLLYTTNPDTPLHWIKTRLIDGGEATVHYSSAEDNPYLPR